MSCPTCAKFRSWTHEAIRKRLEVMEQKMAAKKRAAAITLNYTTAQRGSGIGQRNDPRGSAERGSPLSPVIEESPPGIRASTTIAALPGGSTSG